MQCRTPSDDEDRLTGNKPRWVEFGRSVARRFYDDRCMQIASSLTFTSLLAIVPIVTVALTIITAFPVFGAMTTSLQTFILDNMMPASADVIANYTQQFTRNAARLTAVGIAFLFVTSIMVLLTIERAFNDIWRVRKPRPIVQRLNSELVRALKLPDVRDRLLSQSTEPVGNTPQEFGAFMKREHAKWAKVIKAANVRIQ